MNTRTNPHARELQPEFAVTVKLANNLLIAQREALGLSTRQMAASAGISYAMYVALENLHISPFTKRGAWRDAAVRLAAFFALQPEDIFPAAICQVEKSEVRTTLRASDMRTLEAGLSGFSLQSSLPPDAEAEHGEVREALAVALASRMRPQEIRVLEARYGDGKTLKQIGTRMGVSRTRVAQIERHALRKLRRDKALHDALFGADK